MPDYPDLIDALETLTGGDTSAIGSLQAEEATGKKNSTLQNEAREAIRAIRGHLGDDPAGRYADLQARLSADTATLTRAQRGLHRFHQALANRHSAPVKILCIGDSRTEGSSSSSAPELIDELEDRWVWLLQRKLRETYPSETTGDGGGFGYWAVHYASSNLDSLEPTRSGTVTLITDGGPGLRDAALGSTGPGTVTWATVHGTSVDIWWVGSNGGGKMEYEIDGSGTWVEIDTNSGEADLLLHNHLTHVTLGASDDYQIKVRWKAQGSGGAPTPRIAGIYVYDGDESAGIHVMEAGHSGHQASSLLGATVINQLSEMVTQFGPDLVLVYLDRNEWNNGVQLDTYQANMESLIAELRDADDELEIVLIADWNPLADLGDPIATPAEYHDRMYAVASGDRLVTIINLLDFLPDADQSVADDAELYDLLAWHQDAQGAIATAEVIAEQVRPRPGSLSYDTDRFVTIDVTDDVTDLNGGAFDHGTTGYCHLTFRIVNGACEGYIEIFIDSDATFAATYGNYLVPEAVLPGRVTAPPAGFYWPGSFGYVVDVAGATHAHIGVVPTIIDIGGGNNPMCLIRVTSTGVGVGSLFDFTTPDDFTGLAAKYLGWFRYPVET